MDLPSISIITITFNSEKHIEQTIQSVVEQTYTNFEYIIVDGASTDSTPDKINNHVDHIDQWISEPDKGISDAMNKGLKLSKGEYIMFLHSDDYFHKPDSLEKASAYLDGDHDIFLFNLYYIENGKKNLVKPRGLNRWINFKTGVMHQSAFCTRKLFERIGNFDTNLKIAMDYDLFLRAYRSGTRTKYIDLPLSNMRKTGISSQTNWPSLKERFSEEYKVHMKNCPNNYMKSLYMLYWAIYLPYRYFLSAASSHNK